MSILSKMRITHKISALMIGLATGFVAIGITYYIQITISQKMQETEKQAFVYLQKLNQLKQMETSLRYQSARAAVTLDLTEFETTLASLKSEIENVSSDTLTMGLESNITEIKTQIDAYQALVDEELVTAQALGNIARSGPMFQLNQFLNRLDERMSDSVESSTQASLFSFENALIAFASAPSPTSLEEVDIRQQAFIEQWQANLEQSSRQANQAAPLEAFQRLYGEFQTAASRFIAATDTLEAHQNQMDNTLNELTQASTAGWIAQLDRSAKQSKATQAVVTAIIFLVAMCTAVGIYLIYKSIVFPMAHMQNVIHRINRGKLKSRVKIVADDELGDLGRAFNTLFDERINQLETQSKENERLNNSIISLIQALGSIARKDLTIKVPVSSDITGTISDAVNLLTSETASTLQEVQHISGDVNAVSDRLYDQSQLVMQIADGERKQILATTKALKLLASAMTEVASQSEQADISASQAIHSTQAAKHAVGETVEGIRTIRETISETEKRMKRLGDRSQEISGIVNLINTIAERTHILALNASMHAASAGEAGKGFAVVAEEVQRLAESARQSTDEISAMVNNIRVETSDTATIMNTLISQVAEGSRLAEHAGKQMDQTEDTTKELVETVKRIAMEAIQQASVANKVKDRTVIIKNFSDKTERQLQEQRLFTDALRDCANTLVERVSVFRLPEAQKAHTSIMETLQTSTTETQEETTTPMSSVG